MANRKYENLKKRKNDTISEIKDNTAKFDVISKEAERVSELSSNVSVILKDLDKQFEQATKLTKSDMGFLFFATALQCIRQYMLTPYKERATDKESAREAHEEERKIFDKVETQDIRDKTKRYYVSLNDMMVQGVPYDTQFGSADFNLGLSGNAHRFRTLGHDPLFGWVFGTANIMTNTLTDWSFQSYHVRPSAMANGRLKPKIVQHADTMLMMEKVIERSKAEPQALAVAVVKQRLHLKSDMFSVAGLSIPAMTALSPEIAQTLAEHGVDTANMLTTGKQAAYSIFINTLIAVIHGLFYDEAYGNRKLYDVRTRKILSYSNLIASVSNIIGVALAEAIAISTGNEELGKDGLRYLDVGGMAVTIYRIVNDKKFIRQIKQEFLENEFYEMVMATDSEI